MHPVFFEFNGFVIHTYGVMAAIGFIAAITIASFFGKREGINPEHISDLAVYVILSAIIGARVFYLFVDPSYFIKNPIEIFKIWKGGLVFYGGFIFAALTAVIFVKRKKLPMGKTADVIAPAIAMGHAIGRLGCLFAGCCYGRPTNLDIGIVFRDENCLAPLNQALHPTQLYAVLSNMLIFVLLIFFINKKKKDGDLFLLYLFLYGAFRIVIEYFRGDDRGELIFGILTISQTIGVMTILFSVLIFIFSRNGVLKNNNG